MKWWANGQPEVGRNLLKTTSLDVGGDETECPVEAGRRQPEIS